MIALLLVFVIGCANVLADRGLIYTEQGLEAAEQVWHAAYYEKLHQCMRENEALTPEAEKCFGPTYDADAAVSQVIETVVELLRAYWVSRSLGESPDLRELVQRIDELIKTLPPEARAVFDRVKGL